MVVETAVADRVGLMQQGYAVLTALEEAGAQIDTIHHTGIGADYRTHEFEGWDGKPSTEELADLQILIWDYISQLNQNSAIFNELAIQMNAQNIGYGVLSAMKSSPDVIRRMDLTESLQTAVEDHPEVDDIADLARLVYLAREDVQNHSLGYYSIRVICERAGIEFPERPELPDQ